MLLTLIEACKVFGEAFQELEHFLRGIMATNEDYFYAYSTN